jgi:hypothetical protein
MLAKSQFPYLDVPPLSANFSAMLLVSTSIQLGCCCIAFSSLIRWLERVQRADPKLQMAALEL